MRGRRLLAFHFRWTLTLVCGALPLGGRPAQAEDLPVLAARLERSVVSVIAYEPGRPSTTETYKILGGGCFVTSAGHVLTADHVLQRVIQPEGHVRRTADLSRLAIGWMPDAESDQATIITNQSGQNIHVLKRDPAKDIALLQIKTDQELTPVVVAWSDAPTGTDVIVLGFPFGNTLGFRPLLTRATIAGGRSLPGRTKDADRFRGYILDGSVQHGHSGAPVFDTDTGAVVGLVQRRITETIPVAIAASELSTFLKDTRVEGNPKQKGQSDTQ